MKIYKVIIAFISIALFAQNTYGQVNRNKSIRTGNNNSQSSLEALTGQSMNNDAFTSTGVDYKFDYGTETGMYLYENWLPGNIILKDGTVINDKLLRYNIYTRQMEFVSKTDTMAIANAVEVKELNIGDHKFVFGSFIYDNKPIQDWIEVLIDGEYGLFLYRRIVYRYVESLSESNPETDRFFMTEKYYVQDNGGEIKELPKTKRQIAKCLSKNSPDIESYIRENKLKLTEEGDLIKLIEYCNSKKE